MRLLKHKLLSLLVCSVLTASSSILADTIQPNTPQTTSVATPITNSGSISPLNNLIPDTIANNEKTVTFEQINKGKLINFKGAASTKTINVPVPRQWNISNIRLHLNFDHPVIDHGNIVLTIYINDRPQFTKTIMGTDTQSASWDINIDKSLINDDYVNLKVVSTIGEFNCNNLSNPNYWLTVNPNSTVTYQYVAIEYTPDLSTFPYPFINNTSLQPDNVVIALPESPSSNDMTAAFYLVNYLTSAQVSQGIKITTVINSALTDDQKQHANIIYLGDTAAVKFNTLGITWPLAMDDDGVIISVNASTMASTTGAIMLAPSPWNDSRAVMAITGNSPTGYLKAVNALRNPNFASSIVYNNYTLIDKQNTYLQPSIDWKSTTLASLGFKDEVVYGNGDNQINYTINLPMNKIPTSVQLKLNIDSSPLLSTTTESYATLVVNEVTLNAMVIKPGAKSIKWDVELSNKKFWPGENDIAVVLNLKSPTVGCNDSDQALAWATILNTSELRIDLKSSMPYATFPMMLQSSSDIIVAYPLNAATTLGPDYLNHITAIAGNIDGLKTVELTTTNSVSFKGATNKQILYIGDINDNIRLSDLKNYLPFYYEKQKLITQESLQKKFHISNEIPTAIIETIYLPDDQLFMLVTARDPDGYQQAFKFLETIKPSLLSHENVALLYKDSRYVLLQTTEIENDKELTLTDKILKYFLMSLILAALVGVWFIINAIKNYLEDKENKKE